MKSKIAIIIVALLTTACSGTTNNIFNGQFNCKYKTSGNTVVKDSTLILSGENSLITFNDNYKNFSLTLELRTTASAKGAVWFHTNPQLEKGYKVAINNNNSAQEWWKMSGSLLSVRNLTKSFVKDDEWFTMNITVQDKTINVLINGFPVVEYTEPDKPYRIEPNLKSLLSEGSFAIENNSNGSIECRSIEVNKLPEYNTPQTVIDEQNDKIIRLHQEDFPVLDYHVHLKGGLTKEAAIKQSRRLGINYAISPNCGKGFTITSNEEISGYIDTMRNQPFILAMQAEGREWVNTFSQEARDEFDYVITDALTFTDNKNRRTRLWIAEETWIDDPDKYMDMIVDRICAVLTEPADVYVNPCFLPKPMDERFDEYWTDQRIDKFIKALAASGKALEINELYKIPSKKIILRAKDAGVKFTFGSNNVTPDVSDLAYSLQMKNECDITSKDMYKPKIK